MLVPMTKVRILGPLDDADRALDQLHQLGLVEIINASTEDGVDRLDGESTRSARREELSVLLAEVEKLLTGLPPLSTHQHASPPEDLTGLPAELDTLTSRVADLDLRSDELNDERLALVGYLEPLRRLLPLVPVLAGLDVDKLRLLGLATVALVLNADDAHVVDLLHAELDGALGSRFELATTDVEDGAIGCLIVFPSNHTDFVQTIFGRAAVRSVALPTRFGGLSLHATVDALQARLEEIPREATAVEHRRQELLVPRMERLCALRAGLSTDIELLAAVGSLGATERTFLIECWVPRPRLKQLRRELASLLGSAIAVEDTSSNASDPQAPVLMHNTRWPRPLESLVGFLDLPRAGSVDPTVLMAIFLPLMFGAMVGDVGYGAVLLVIAAAAQRKLSARAASAPEIRSLIWVLLWGAAWSIVFGVLYGELFGDLGRRAFGDWALWQYRASASALQPLLIFAVVVGAAHVVIGLGLGAWQAVRFREPRALFDKIGNLLALTGLFGLAGWSADQLPTGALTPSLAAVVVGLVLVMSLHGALGLITGVLDLVGRVGNILSYLRIAAVGLASAHLAGVANELGSVGPLWLGVIVAAFLHALNLALASFSPMIQALRLNYVEFFGTFFVGGGRAFEPFGHEKERVTPSTTSRSTQWKLA